MDAAKAAWLTQTLGKDLAADVLARAYAMTDVLEKNVRFKQIEEEEVQLPVKISVIIEEPKATVPPSDAFPPSDAAPVSAAKAYADDIIVQRPLEASKEAKSHPNPYIADLAAGRFLS